MTDQEIFWEADHDGCHARGRGQRPEILLQCLEEVHEEQISEEVPAEETASLGKKYGTIHFS